MSRATIRPVLRRYGLPPAPRRGRTAWHAFLAQQRDQLVACDFFTVDTLFLQRLYVLVFIELGSRRLHLARCTAAPDAAWVTQQAWQLSWHLQETAASPSAPSSAIVAASSRRASTPSLRQKGSRSSRRRRRRRTPTPVPSGSSAHSARNAWTGSSSSTSRTCGPYSPTTWPTTTTGDRTRAETKSLRCPSPPQHGRRTPRGSGAGQSSAASSTTTTSPPEADDAAPGQAQVVSPTRIRTAAPGWQCLRAGLSRAPRAADRLAPAPGCSSLAIGQVGDGARCPLSGY